MTARGDPSIFSLGYLQQYEKQRETTSLLDKILLLVSTRTRQRRVKADPSRPFIRSTSDSLEATTLGFSELLLEKTFCINKNEDFQAPFAYPCRWPIPKTVPKPRSGHLDGGRLWLGLGHRQTPGGGGVADGWLGERFCWRRWTFLYGFFWIFGCLR